MLRAAGFNFSFSGLKTAVRQTLQHLPATPSDQDIADLCAGFQAAVTETLCGRLKPAIAAFKAEHPAGRHLVVAGGVAANSALRAALQTLVEKSGLAFVAPPTRSRVSIPTIRSFKAPIPARALPPSGETASANSSTSPRRVLTSARSRSSSVRLAATLPSRPPIRARVSLGGRSGK